MKKEEKIISNTEHPISNIEVKKGKSRRDGLFVEISSNRIISSSGAAYEIVKSL